MQKVGPRSLAWTNGEEESDSFARAELPSSTTQIVPECRRFQYNSSSIVPTLQNFNKMVPEFPTFAFLRGGMAV